VRFTTPMMSVRSPSSSERERRRHGKRDRMAYFTVKDAQDAKECFIVRREAGEDARPRKSQLE
jgi:hypothetical protein